MKRIVADIVRVNSEATALQEQLETLPEGKDHTTASTELQRRVTRLGALVDELGEVGPN